jgi:hypothetical protein
MLTLLLLGITALIYRPKALLHCVMKAPAYKNKEGQK